MPQELEVEYWWRAEDITYAPSADEHGDRHGPGTRSISWTKFRVLSHTPKGVWVFRGTFYPADDDIGEVPQTNKSFVLRAQGGKRLCHPTKEDALLSYIARKERQARILAKRLAGAQAFKALAEAQLTKTSPLAMPI